MLLCGKKMSKKQTKFAFVWGGSIKLRGEISLPKGPEKTLCGITYVKRYTISYTTHLMNVRLTPAIAFIHLVINYLY